MDQERHTLTVVKDHKGKSLIKESRDSDGHSLRYGPSCLWLGIKLTELSLVSTVRRKKGKEVASETIEGSGQFITAGTDRRIQIGSVLSFGSDKTALQGKVEIDLASSGREGLDFYVHEPSTENSSSNGEECWSIGALFGAVEFNNILDAMRSSRLSGVTIAFDATNSPLIFDDTHIHHLEKNCIKLLSDPIRLALDSEWPLHSELSLLELPLELYWPREFQVDDDFIKDFYVKVYTSTTAL